MKSILVLAPAALVFAGLALPADAVTGQHAEQTQRADNARQSADLRARIGRVETRIGTAERSKAISRTRAADLRRQVARMRQNMASLARRQGFVSAAELASYNRWLGTIDVALDNRGVPRSLEGDVPNQGERSYDNDALPSAEVEAFQRTDARLHYRNARIDRDRQGCAVYQGTARDGRVRRERLLSTSRQPICTRR